MPHERDAVGAVKLISHREGVAPMLGWLTSCRTRVLVVCFGSPDAAVGQLTGTVGWWGYCGHIAQGCLTQGSLVDVKAPRELA
ncbi:hypothetical protein M405DRAFT_626506 [Rhizopogon salebrosus TDB-379]|nr:hypothetical protein M405DRAFT_626506 [Rhizopogon salebrosus TDB-379]